VEVRPKEQVSLKLQANSGPNTSKNRNKRTAGDAEEATRPVAVQERPDAREYVGLGLERDKNNENSCISISLSRLEDAHNGFIREKKVKSLEVPERTPTTN